MTTLLLIRHGETDAVGKLLSGWLPGWHLNETGKQQARELARRLANRPLRAVYTSPLERTVETALPIASSHGLVPRTVPEIGEFHAGEWQGWSFADLEGREDWRRFNTSRENARPPGGESMLEMQQRMLAQLRRLAVRHKDEQIAVVSHGDPLRAALVALRGQSLDSMLRFEVEPASVSVVQVTDERWEVRSINETGELQHEISNVH